MAKSVKPLPMASFLDIKIETYLDLHEILIKRLAFQCISMRFLTNGKTIH